MDVSELAALARRQRSDAWRVVETQEIAATAAITANSAEQSRLEELLEEAKPPLPADLHGLSYLLFTPFRYPPLRYGSRFGSEFERGIFYGALELETAFAESAVYLWLFRAGPRELGPLEVIRDQRSSYRVPVVAEQGLDLRDDAFAGVRAGLTRRDDWSVPQRFGSIAREAKVQAIWYPSCRYAGTNVAVLDPTALAARREANVQAWHLVLDSERCWFGAQPRGDSFEFSFAALADNGTIPHPAL
ncbi:MAG: RES family NAD+ phosphorylase [Halieaceae bacterium]|nr:RES family NAD+ phosphorylase [Halieaceae bacterium]